MVKKVLITGVSGLLGGYLYHGDFGEGRRFRQHSRISSYEVVGTWCTTQPKSVHEHYHMDITNSGEVERVLYRFRPNIIIHCAAIGSVDYCERYPGRTRAVNVGGVKNVARMARSLGSKLVFISSNAVYHGDAPPYTEADGRVPVNEYGRQKVDAEDFVDANRHYSGKVDPLIIRPIMMYGWPHPLGRGNWVTTILERVRIDGASVMLVDDTVTQPTYALHVAHAIWALLDLDQSGIWNIGGTDRMSLYRFGRYVDDVFELHADERIIRVGSDHFPDIAPRPRDTTYDMAKLYELADAYPDYRGALLPSGVPAGLSYMKRESPHE